MTLNPPYKIDLWSLGKRRLGLAFSADAAGEPRFEELAALARTAPELKGYGGIPEQGSYRGDAGMMMRREMQCSWTTLM